MLTKKNSKSIFSGKQYSNSLNSSSSISMIKKKLKTKLKIVSFDVTIIDQKHDIEIVLAYFNNKENLYLFSAYKNYQGEYYKIVMNDLRKKKNVETRWWTMNMYVQF